MGLADVAIAAVAVAVVVAHLVISPYTKVEESFNIQAIHDMTVYGIPGNSSQLNLYYDHVQFPGAVPRTFVGALLVSLPLRLMQTFIDHPVNLQILGRSIIGIFNGVSLLSLNSAVSKAFGNAAANWFILLLVSQFHVMYYFARPLPNMFAFALTNYALSYVILAASGRYPASQSQTYSVRALTLLTFAGVIFRSEIAVLVATHTLYSLLVEKVPLAKVVEAGLIGLVLGLTITVPVDSFFWNRLTWPELEGFYFNTILGKSSDWGTSPWHYYFINAIPRLLMNPLVYTILIPTAILSTSAGRVSAITAPETAFLAIYSFLPHKEWRFVIYVIPAYTAAAAVGASWIWTRRTKSTLYGLLSLALIGSILLTFGVSLAYLVISSMNYPGGEAILRLHKLASSSPLNIYVDNLACQTGVTRFLEDQKHSLKADDGKPAILHFDKTEDMTTLHDPMFWQQFDYVVVEHPETVIGSWKTHDVVTAFDGLYFMKPGNSPVDPKLDVVERAFVGNDHHPRAWLQKWTELGEYMRQFTKGYWVNIRMSPKLKILKREPLESRAK